MEDNLHNFPPGLQDPSNLMSRNWFYSKLKISLEIFWIQSTREISHLTFFRRIYFIESWWNFLKFWQKENKIFSVHVKDKSFNSLQGLQIYQKETASQMFFCEQSKSFTDSFFNRANTVAAFELSFSISKEFKKRKLLERLPLV